MPAPSPSSAIPPLVQFDLPCTLCGRNLRALAAAASCPNCGITVARSYGPHLLHLASAPVRARLRAALAICASSPIALLCGLIAWWIFSALGARGSGDVPNWIIASFVWSYAGSAALWCAGGWMLARAMPDGALAPYMVRVSVVATQVLAPLTALAWFLAAVGWTFAALDSAPLSPTLYAMAWAAVVIAVLLWCSLLTTCSILVTRLFAGVADYSSRDRAASQSRAVFILVAAGVALAPILILGLLSISWTDLKLRRAIAKLPPPPAPAPPA